jgi:hypothetical protein
LSGVSQHIIGLAFNSFDPFATINQRGKLVLIKLQLELLRERESMDEDFFKKRVMTPLINCLKSPENHDIDDMIYSALLADMM